MPASSVSSGSVTTQQLMVFLEVWGGLLWVLAGVLFAAAHPQRKDENAGDRRGYEPPEGWGTGGVELLLYFY